MIKNNVYTNIKLNDETYEVKVIDGELYLPQPITSSNGVVQIYYLKVSSSILKQLTHNKKVRRSSRRTSH